MISGIVISPSRVTAGMSNTEIRCTAINSVTETRNMETMAPVIKAMDDSSSGKVSSGHRIRVMVPKNTDTDEKKCTVTKWEEAMVVNAMEEI